MDTAGRIKAAIRDVPDFPEPGIIFKDITPVLLAPELFREAIDLFAERHSGSGIDKIVGIDARGFIFAAALSDRLGVGFVPVRKIGKLPHETYEQSYDLEYGSATLTMHKDAVGDGERVLLVDDLLATGGTASAAVMLLETAGAEVHEIDFLVELTYLGGRHKLTGYSIYAPIRY